MNERPILFSGEMVRAILAGRKTQTRRVVDLYKILHIPKVADLPIKSLHDWNVAACPAKIDGWVFWQTTRMALGDEAARSLCYDHGVKCPYGNVGDRLWVKETWCPDGDSGAAWLKAGVPIYRLGIKREGFEPYNPFFSNPIPENIKWRSPRFMPRWASRLTLEITNVRVERVQSISEADVLAEGLQLFEYHMADGSTEYRYADERLALGAMPLTAQDAYGRLWNEINLERGYGWHVNPWVWVVEFKRIANG